VRIPHPQALSLHCGSALVDTYHFSYPAMYLKSGTQELRQLEVPLVVQVVQNQLFTTNYNDN
jgi:hypothetical protein